MYFFTFNRRYFFYLSFFTSPEATTILGERKLSIIFEILEMRSVNTWLKLDYESVAPVANCISDLQTELGLAGEVPRIWRERGKACQRAMGGTFYRFIHYPLSDLTRRPSIR